MSVEVSIFTNYWTAVGKTSLSNFTNLKIAHQLAWNSE